jgi:hypothetical protein
MERVRSDGRVLVVTELRAALAVPGDVESQVGFQNEVNTLIAALAAVDAGQPPSDLLETEVKALAGPLPPLLSVPIAPDIVRIEWSNGAWVKRPRAWGAAIS